MLRTLLAPGVFLLAACWPMAAMAGNPDSAEDVVAKYIEALGGQKKLDAVNTMRLTATTTGMGGMEIPMVIERKRPGKGRFEMTFQGMKLTQAFDGETGWMVNPMRGNDKPEKLPPEMIEQMKEQWDMFSPLVNYKKKGNKVELVGTDDVEGTETYKLKVTRKGGKIEYYYLDAEYFLPVKVESTAKFQGTEMKYTQTFGDYKPVDGLMLAHSVSREGGPMAGGGTITFDKVELNVPLPDERFAMPKPEEKEAPVKTEKKPEDEEDAGSKDQG